MDMTQGTVSKYMVGGEWSGQWQYRGRDTLNRQFRKIGFATKAEAQESLDSLISAMRTNSHIVPAKLTVADWFAAWLLTIKETEKETTYASYVETERNRIRPYIGHVRLQALTEDDIRAMYRKLVEKGLATNTILGVHRRMRTCLRAAAAERKISYCPVDNVTPPKGVPQKKTKVWTFDELTIFAKYVSEQRDAAMWALWVTTGLRRGELCGLQWQKVDLERGVATIDWQRTISPGTGLIVEGPVKTENGNREVPLSPRVVEVLRTWKSNQAAIRLAQGSKWQGSDYVFTTANNKPYFPGSFGLRLETLADRAGVPRLTPHELRHTYGTRAAENGMQDTVLMRIMGHSKIEVTKNLYIHPNTDQAKEANDVLAGRMFG